MYTGVGLVSRELIKDPSHHRTFLQRGSNLFVDRPDLGAMISFKG